MPGIAPFMRMRLRSSGRRASTSSTQMPSTSRSLPGYSPKMQRSFSSTRPDITVVTSVPPCRTNSVIFSPTPSLVM